MSETHNLLTDLKDTISAITHAEKNARTAAYMMGGLLYYREAELSQLRHLLAEIQQAHPDVAYMAGWQAAVMSGALEEARP